ncbi:iron-sulfur cluster repair di-iron protein [Bacillus sp. CGMCC 1.16607]|uniref:iron-sulfur cluster repair di-iron protein n=1 Tax=Bacillus sp. CGMCC 1.16607 TaxID=3351842 RepID=UPI0036293E13
MNFPFTEQSLVKDIVNDFPKSSDIFKRNRIDFCCGGNTPLSSAVVANSINIESLLSELKELYEKSEHNGQNDMEVWLESDSKTIINHVIERYHRPLEEELSLLSPYVTKVAKVHGDSHPELLRVYELFYELKKELLEHTKKEEEISFPLILKIEEGNVENKEDAISQIVQLEKEHDHAGEILRELREITSDYVPPVDACGTYRLVYKRLEMLEGETFMHVHLENNILFPRYI